MALKNYKPNTPGLRQKTTLVKSEVTAQKPEKSLTTSLHQNSGRDTFGRISVRRRGGGVKRAYRIIDFKRNKYGVPGTVKTIEYDPNRSVLIALVFYADGEKRYILAPKGLTVGTKVFLLNLRLVLSNLAEITGKGQRTLCVKIVCFMF